MLRLYLAALGIFSVLNVCTSFQFQHTEFKELAKAGPPACSPAGSQRELVGSQERGQGQTELLPYSPTEGGCDPQCVEILTSRQAVASATHSSWVPSNPSRAAMARVTGFVHRAPLIPFPSQMSITNLGIFFYLACDLLEGFPWHYH